MVSRSGDRPNAELYEFDLSEPIPCFPVPLQANDLEPAINLQQMVNELYTRARLDLAIDYSRSLTPALLESETAWVNGILSA